jgi:nitroimidazol reductase NimA-like FMN-containing flavoprotein (pyridoxamine 5'-phosphate oxidase superfamily)
MTLPPAARAVLDRGVFCHVAASTPLGPHVTPMVYAVAGGRLWVTTSRGSVKARAWRGDPRVAGLVVAGSEAVAFVGLALRHDALDASTWTRSMREGPLVALAAARFTRKNARFFAGYAVDAPRVPLAWTPPGRVFVELRPERLVRIEEGRPVRGWLGGGGAPPVPTRDRFRVARAGSPTLDALPREIRRELGDGGPAVLAVEGRNGPAVVPAAWTVDGAAVFAVLPEDRLALAEPETPAPRVALEIDRPSSWRARNMVGAMVRGPAEIVAPGRLVSGAEGAARIATGAGIESDDATVAAVRARRLVWWRGWDSGTVRVGGPERTRGTRVRA